MYNFDPYNVLLAIAANIPVTYDCFCAPASHLLRRFAWISCRLKRPNIKLPVESLRRDELQTRWAHASVYWHHIVNHGGFQPPLASRKSTIHSFISRWTAPEEAANKARSQTDSNYHLHTCQTRPDKQINSPANVYSHDKLHLFAERSPWTLIHHGLLARPSLASSNKNAFLPYATQRMQSKPLSFPADCIFYSCISQSAVSLWNDTCRWRREWINILKTH